MMTDVACFCGCCFSFDGGAAACPRCGEIASVTAGLALEDAGRSQPKTLVPAASALSGRPAGAVLERGELAARRPLPAYSRN
jgi:hypothetical protein